MNKASKILLFLLLCFSRVFSQGMYIPLEFQEAYENGTRSLDGKPGADYWQNHSDYRITAELDPVSGKLSGSAVITYFNSSPDTLDRLVFRLYQNIQKKDAMRDFIINSKDSSEGLVINALSIGKRTFSPSGDTSLEYTGTNLIVKNLSIMPGKQTTINVSWEFKIPGSEGIRMGRYDSTSFFIAYWYPQVAVYDDIDGWDMTEYTGNAEFYNDFNNYDVKITLPSDYCSWATGELQNPQDVLSANVLSRYSEAMASSTTVNIITANDIVSAEPLFNNSAGTNTWHYIAKGVTDFTFAAAASYLWDGRLADSGGKKVFVSAAYKESSLNYYEVCDISAKTIEIASRDLPGIIFPFPKITVFDGRGGMESPMMVNMGPGEQRIWTVHTTVHEVMHSYFPFYMGINERKYAWMDEGWTQMLSEYIQFEIDKTIDFRERNVKRYLDYAGQFDEVPMMYPSYNIRGEMYGNHAYFRPANAFNILKDFMGDAVFKKALQEFMKRWNGKHPMPYDLFLTFEDVTDDDLDWYFEPWFFMQGYPDVSVDTAFVKDNMLKIQVTKEGTLPIPVAVTVKLKDGSTKRAYRSASSWKNEDEDEITIEMEIEGKPSYIELGSQYIPDVDSLNNIWHFK